MSTRVSKAFAPASVSNVAVGFDILGFSFNGAGDEVELEWNDSGPIGVKVLEIKSQRNEFDVGKIPKDSLRNTAAVAVQAMMNGLELQGQVNLKILKGIPLSSGMGGSAASAVAAVVALNALLPRKLEWSELLSFAMEGERVASGATHYDNVLPSLRGGFNLVATPKNFVQLKVPNEMKCVLVHPDIEVQTRFARSLLTENVALKTYVQQSGLLAGFIAGCFYSDWELISATLEDLIIEPQRMKLIPGFKQAKEAALKAGALGFSISGSGPTVFALVKDQKTAEEIAREVTRVFEAQAIHSQNWIGPVMSEGARVL